MKGKEVKKLLGTSASLLVTSALLVVTMFAIRNNKLLENTQIPNGPTQLWNYWINILVSYDHPVTMMYNGTVGIAYGYGSITHLIF